MKAPRHEFDAKYHSRFNERKSSVYKIQFMMGLLFIHTERTLQINIRLIEFQFENENVSIRNSVEL